MPSSGWIDRIRSWWHQDEGQTAAEYAVVLGVITPLIAIAYMTLGDTIAPIFDKVTSLL